VISSLGFDSLMAVELRNRIEADLGVLVPTAVLLQAETSRAIAAAITERHKPEVLAVHGTAGSVWTEGEI